MISMRSYLAETEKRKAELGIVDTAESTEAMRNKGTNRTPEKREGLRQAAGRAVAAGRQPVLAYW